MDVWTFVAGALVGLGGLFVGTAKDLITRHFQRKDKESDRRAAREDAHQADLRNAYAEFIAAYSRYLGLGGMMASEAKALAEQRDEAYERAIQSGLAEPEAQQYLVTGGNPDLIEKARRTIEEFAAAGMEVDKRTTHVLLLENDPARSELMHAIMEDNLKPPQGVRDNARFRDDIVARMRRMEELVRMLSGRFAPTPNPRALPAGGSSKLLKPGGDGGS